MSAKLIELATHLLKRTANGDQMAFKELYERHKDFVFRVALEHGISRDDAADTVQETFVRLYRHAGDLKLRGKLETWLYTVVTNLCKDAARKRSRQARLSIAKGESSNPERDAIASDCWRKSHQTLSTLSKTQREIFLLRFFYGMSNAEIVKISGRSSESVRVHLCRALKKIQKRLHVAER